MRLTRGIAAAMVALALLASGCATVPPQQAFNREASTIRTIQVLPMARSEIGLAFLNHPGTNFGLIGGLVAATDISSKQGKLREQMTASQLDHLAVFREAFATAMQAQGYTIRWSEPLPVKNNVARDRWGLRKGYGPIAGADAQLDLSLIFAGYATSGAGDASPYRPAVHVAARLLDPSGQQNLFTDVVTYNNITNIPTAITLNPDPQHAYPDFKQLEAAGPDVATGVKAALAATAKRLSEQF